MGQKSAISRDKSIMLIGIFLISLKLPNFNGLKFVWMDHGYGSNIIF